MIRSTFRHFPGISAAAEQQLWAAGICSWDCAGPMAGINLPSRWLQAIDRHLHESRQKLDGGDCGYFAGLLPSREHWRLFPEFRSNIAYLDIETTGLSSFASHITTIALYDGRSIRHYVHGENLDQFRRDIGDYGLVVTYNGKCFDLPFIRQALDLKMDQAHIDLRYVLKSLGYGGGLKGCEKKLGLDRGELDGVDGFFAVLLWQDYRRSGNPRSLETLLAYNIQDVVNLETVLVMAYNLKLAATPFAQSHRLAMPRPPKLPFVPDRETVQRLKRQYERCMVRW